MKNVKLNQNIKSWALTLLMVLGGVFAPLFAQANCIDPPNGLVGWWPGDDNTNDISGGNHNGTGGGSYVTGEVADAFHIGGVLGNIVTVPNDPTLQPADVTVDAWVKLSSSDQFRWIVAKGADQCNSASYGLFTSPDQVRFIVSNGGNNFAFAGAPLTTLTSDGAWHFLAGTYDGNQVSLYIDGNLVATTAFNSPIDYNTSPSQDLLIGGYADSACPNGGTNNYTFNGDIDEVQIYNVALSAGTIADIYNAGSFGVCKVKTIAIDIKPGSFPNCFNINSSGVIPVALLGSADFDVNDVNVSSLSFNGLTVQIRGKGPLCHVEYVNDDDYEDLLCQFEDNVSMWDTGSSTGIVTGTLNDGTKIQGEDSICVVPN